MAPAEESEQLLRQPSSRFPGLTSNQLKLIAILAMVMDHGVTLFLPRALPAYLFLRMVGRVAAPTICFLVAEGYAHTSDLKKYMGRLLLFAVISHIPYNLCFGFSLWAFWQSTSVLWSLFLGLAALAAAKADKLPLPGKILTVLLCCGLAYSADWNYIAVLLILAFGLFRGQPAKRSAAHFAVGLLYLAQGLRYGLPLIPRLGIFLTIPLLLLYNGRHGKKSRMLQWSFYVFYPAHLLILWLLDLLI